MLNSIAVDGNTASQDGVVRSPALPVLWEAVYPIDPWGHGGARRCAQIMALLDRAQIKAERFELPSHVGFISKYIRGIRFSRQESWPKLRQRRQIAWCGQMVRLRELALDKLSTPGCILWDNTRAIYWPSIAHSRGLPIIAIPQNIEALVSDAWFFESTTEANLAMEIRALRQVDAVFCISYEEQWLLRNCGIAAECLPYFPVEEVAQTLQQIRVRRQVEGSRNNHVLIFGSAGNGPTFEGMRSLIDRLGNMMDDPRLQDLTFDVAGFGTEKLLETCRQKGRTNQLRVHGAVSQAHLERLQCSARAVLIHQERGAGYLTRIPEMLLAGIPIIGNRMACRSSLGLSGVHVYDNDAELAELLSADLPTPEIPCAPRAAEAGFIATMRRLCKA